MSLIRISADNPAALLAAAVLLFVLGLAGIAALPIQMLPNLEYPEININTSWRNAEMSSNVRSGNGNVDLRFDVGTDLQQAMLDVLNALNHVEAAPPDAGEPEIQVGGWDFPVATLLVHPRVPRPGTDVTDFQRIIDTEVEPRLLAIDGVQRVNLRSERDRMVLISFDPYRAATRCGAPSTPLVGLRASAAASTRCGSWADSIRKNSAT
jgi:HAE1 family hydrophobic/amphiphilic exporter-1